MMGMLYRSKNFLAFSILVCLNFGSAKSQSKPKDFDRVEPSNWWIGMKNTEFQILFYKHDADISNYDASINYPGISIKEKIKVENPHYLFLKLKLSPEAKAGVVPIQFKSGKKSFVYS